MAVTPGYVGSSAITWSASATATVSGASIGTAAWDRVVVVAVTVEIDAAINSCTIGGNAATAGPNLSNTAATPDLSAAFFYLPVPAGTTANIAVTLSASVSTTGRISVWAMTGAALPHFDSNTASGSATSINLGGVTISTGGAGFWSWCNQTAAAVVWTSATVRDSTNPGTYQHSVADTTTAGTPTVNANGANAQNTIIGMSFNEAPPRGFDFIAPDTNIAARESKAATSLALAAAAGLILAPIAPSAPEEEPPSTFSMASITTGGVFRRPLHYQARVTPLRPIVAAAISAEGWRTRTNTIPVHAKLRYSALNTTAQPWPVAPPPPVASSEPFSITTGSATRKTLFYQALARPIFVAEEDNNVTIDKWQQPLAGVPPTTQAQNRQYQPFVPEEATRDNTVAFNTWYQRLSTVAPKYVPPRILAQPFVPPAAVLDNTVTPDKWLPAWRGAPRQLLGLPGGAPFVPEEAVLENTVTPDAWMQPFNQAVPIVRPAQPTQPVLGYPYEAEDNSRFEWDWTISWQGPPRVLQPLAAGTVYPPQAPFEDNTVTVDKWKLEWNLAAKATRPIHTQPVFGYPYEGVDNTRPQWDWNLPWQGPPRYWPLGKPYSPFVPKEAVLENTVTPDNWLISWKGPPRYWPPKIVAQPFIPFPEVVDNTRFAWDWSIQWQGPPKYSPPSIAAQPFVPAEATIENTVTPDKWLVRWQKAVAAPPVRPTQPFYGFPYEGVDNTRTVWDWTIAWEGPPRAVPPIPSAQPFVPKEAVLDNTVTPDKWLVRWQKAAPRPDVWPTQPVYGFPYEDVDNSRTEWDWFIQWKGAPRYWWQGRPFQPFVPRAATLENTVTPDKWLQAFGAQQRRTVPFSSSTQFVPIAAAQFPIEWFQALSRAPARYAVPYQQLGFIYAPAAEDNTVTIEKWQQAFTSATVVARLYKESVSFTPTPPVEEEVVEALPVFPITTSFTFSRTLYYQAIAAPIIIPPVVEIEGRTFTVTTSFTFSRSLYYQAVAAPIGVPVEVVVPPEPPVTPPKSWTQEGGIEAAWTPDLPGVCIDDIEAENAFQEEAFQEDAFQLFDETTAVALTCWTVEVTEVGGWSVDTPVADEWEEDEAVEGEWTPDEPDP